MPRRRVKIAPPNAKTGVHVFDLATFVLHYFELG
jgi:hypothetical protein